MDFSDNPLAIQPYAAPGSGSGADKPRRKRRPNNPPAVVREKRPEITMPCSECGKRFWSWKALFGHMRCHPERHWRGINPPASVSASAAGGGGGSEEENEVAAALLLLASGGGCFKKALGTSRKALGVHRKGWLSVNGGGGAPAAEHKCGICLRSFSSGQALGGHKRCHWESREGDGAAAAISRGLDLNLPPVEDEEDEYTYHSNNSMALDLRLGL